MSAIALQRTKITAFCEESGIPAPNFASTQDLTRCIGAALDLLDGESVEELEAERDLLRAAVDAATTEGARLETAAAERYEARRTVEAVKLLAQIEQLADAAIRRHSARSAAPTV